MDIHRPKIDPISKKIFSVIHIPTQYQHDILISSGYKPHHNLNGWIKNLSGASRFHAVEDKEMWKSAVDGILLEAYNKIIIRIMV